VEFVTRSADETRALGSKLAKVLLPGDVVALYGELGSGKTTLIQGILSGLGYSGRVQSPSFIIARTYETNPRIKHVDLYRLEEGAVDALHLEEIFEPEGVMLVEWAQRSTWFPGEASKVTIRFAQESDDERVINIEGPIEERMS
jgi:tRNA threonylcarbamoyladenosine biosynthesis protein TsaE